ncbi:hypothetical protein GGR28_002475 [Lewinella aquimaris]|uniref:Uncharacterized protein n=2 Tax=Neolewinella aquimaris TaxID=1835722 RepID=A0A840ECZ2_9BACT|nr:hypothetical protein [Neolewinella aquimaris]
MDSFAYIIRDRNENRLVAYRSYAFSNEERKDWSAAFGRLVAADAKLNGTRYGKLTLAWDTPVLNLVPGPLFDEESTRSYLEQLTLVGLEDEVRHEHLHELDAEIIYSARRDHLATAERTLGTDGSQHYAGSLLTAWAARSRRLNHQAISCAVRGQRMFVAGHRNGNLEYYNTFVYGSAQDGIYYMLLAYEQCDFAPDRIPLYLCGELTTEGELYGQFYQYIEDIRFSEYGVPPAAPAELIHLPAHLYFDLLCLG